MLLIFIYIHFFILFLLKVVLNYIVLNNLFVFYFIFFNIIFFVNFIYFWFVMFMYFIFFIIFFLIIKKMYSILKFKVIVCAYTVLLFVLIILFYVEDLLIFILLFESILSVLLFIILHFIFNNRFIIAVVYLILFSSLSGVLCFVLLILLFLNNNVINFFLLQELLLMSDIHNILFIWLTIFLIFGIKFPVYPFYFWLLSVHVEVSSEMSIFLASILLKAGFVGVFKFLYVYMNFISFFFINLSSSFILIGTLYITFNLLVTLDYKKILGMWSILHVNLSLIILWYNNTLFTLVCVFSNLSHIISSGSFFIIIGYVYENFNNKNMFLISGFYGASIMNFILLVATLNNIDFPFFVMFYLELVTFYVFAMLSFYFIIILIIINVTLFVSSLFIYFLLNFYIIKWNNQYLRSDLTINDYNNLHTILVYGCCLYWILHIL